MLPYTGRSSLDLRARLRHTIEKNIPFVSFKALVTCLGSKIPLRKISYSYTCSNCKVIYYGKTFRHFFTRASEHMGT